MTDQSVEDALLDAYDSSANALNHIRLLWLAVLPEGREHTTAPPLHGGALSHIIAIIQEHVERSHTQARVALALLRSPL